MKKLFGLALVLIGLGVSVVAQQVVTGAKSTDEAALIKAEAEKSSRAFVDRDFSLVLDSTFPKVVEMSGGKVKLLAEIDNEMKRLQDAGMKIISHTVGDPQPSVRIGKMLVSVVPTSLKMESPSAFLTQASFWLAISTDDGKRWTFVDGTSLNSESMKILLPEAVDKIKLPDKGQAVVERKPAA